MICDGDRWCQAHVEAGRDLVSEYLTVLAPAALPAAGSFFGGIVAEALAVSRRTLSPSLHAGGSALFALFALISVVVELEA